MQEIVIISWDFTTKEVIDKGGGGGVSTKETEICVNYIENEVHTQLSCFQ